LKKVCESYGVKKITDRAATIKRTIGCADKIIAPSEHIINKFIENGFFNNKQLKDGRIAVLSHGVDAANLKNVVKTSSNCIRFGYIGRAFERKGLHIRIDAFEKLKIKDAELRIYGSTIYPIH
jgi:glycosyltransferase involved in cell wall biosynthesis